MRSLSDTLQRLERLRARTGQFARQQGADPAGGALTSFTGFGSNPGALGAKLHVPDLMVGKPPVVVVLHGCTQTADAYDQGSGWSKLADEQGFIVLYPEQARANNGNLCFNWFVPEDSRRGSGELASIHQMIETVITRHDADPKRVYITGLSAGGAMANAMLAAYPEMFAGGAIIAGLPFATAATVPEAFDRMRGHGLPSEQELQRRLNDASDHQGPWPTVAVWHGTADSTVAEANAQAILAQWRGVHGVATDAAHQDKVAGHDRIVWTDARGRSLLQYYRIGGMGHGTPVDATTGMEKPGPYMLDIGLSSTRMMAQSWGLMPDGIKAEVGSRRAASKQMPPDARTAHAAGSIQGLIEGALRSAGLMR
ncbi:poly(hydroxyalkanoate) depolymerase family esterase [Neorhizobium galegae]|uniref:extracellular catalytic domain type 1 short-chain-length polyhydroxyalkanoate depolymerase n=1 Tax=Neorhizobium galegae TaxID=399 RepID=UPI001AE8AFE8|nr:PHB depolymerase family esterase [Neorhizobium galegae]MBP2550912.1 poly(hydroxyalkanoate) depolymerase family esterase [Neorhizobium galegae]